MFYVPVFVTLLPELISMLKEACRPLTGVSPLQSTAMGPW